MPLHDALTLSKRRGGHDCPSLVLFEPSRSACVEGFALLARAGFRGASKPLTCSYLFGTSHKRSPADPVCLDADSRFPTLYLAVMSLYGITFSHVFYLF